MNFLTLIGIFLLLISCKKDNPGSKEDKPNDDKPIIEGKVPNNSAVLTGESIGSDSEKRDNIWKTGKVILESTSSDFLLDTTIYFTRTASYSSYIFWILQVKNISSKPHAFIKATGIKLLDNNNELIYEDVIDYTFVYGSLGNSDGFPSIVTSTFLNPNETGYFLGIDNVDFSKVKKIKLSSLESNDSKFIQSNITLIPTSYRVSNNKLYISVENKSDQTAHLDFSVYILLDQANKPLRWDYLLPSQVEFISPNSIVTISDTIFYRGFCNKVKPILTVNQSTLKKIKNKFNESFREILKSRDIELNDK